MRKIIVVSLLLILAFCGCDTLDLLRDPPDVDVALNGDPEFKSIDSDSLKFLVKLDVTNKGTATIDNVKINWKFFFMKNLSNEYYEKPFADDSLEVPRITGGQKRTLDVDVPIDIQTLFQQGPSIAAGYYLGQRELRYKIVMEIKYFNIHVGDRTETGTLTLPSGIF